MKKLITAILILASSVLTAQDSTYNNTIKFNMTDSIENGITFQRKATFEAMIYNQRYDQITLQFAIDFYNSDGSKKMKSAKGYTKEIQVTKNVYVVSSNGNVVGSEAQMLALYGVHKGGNVDSAFLKNPGSQFWQLTTPCMTEYDYLCKLIDNTNKISTVIKNIGQREASAGKLN